MYIHTQPRTRTHDHARAHTTTHLFSGLDVWSTNSRIVRAESSTGPGGTYNFTAIVKGRFAHEPTVLGQCFMRLIVSVFACMQPALCPTKRFALCFLSLFPPVVCPTKLSWYQTSVCRANITRESVIQLKWGFTIHSDKFYPSGMKIK